jgi:hypothetical protein
LNNEVISLLPPSFVLKISNLLIFSWQLQVSVEETFFGLFLLSLVHWIANMSSLECWMYVYDEMIFSCRWHHHQSYEVDAFGGFFFFCQFSFLSYSSHLIHVFLSLLSHSFKLVFQYGNWIIIQACKISICRVSHIFVHIYIRFRL